MGDTIKDMVIEIEQKEKDFLENKIGEPVCKNIDELKTLGLNKL